MTTSRHPIPIAALSAALVVAASCDDPAGGPNGRPTDGVSGTWVEVEGLALPGAGAIAEVALATDALDRLHLAVRRGGRVHVLLRQSGAWTHLGAEPVVDEPTARMSLALSGNVPVVASVTAGGEVRVDHFAGGIWAELGSMLGDLGEVSRISASWHDLHMVADQAAVFVGFVDETGVLAIRHYSFLTGGWTAVDPPPDEVGAVGGESVGHLNALGLGDAGLALIYRTAGARSSVVRLQAGIWTTLATFDEGTTLSHAQARRGPDGRAWFVAQTESPGENAGLVFSAGPAELTEHVAGPFATGLSMRNMGVGFDGFVPLVGFQVHGPAEHARRDEVIVRRPVAGAWVELGAEGPGPSEPGIAAFAVAGRQAHVALASNDPVAAAFSVRVLRFVTE